MKLWQNLRENLPDEGPGVWYDPDFMEVIEQHLPIIKKEKSTMTAVDPAKVAMYKADFYGFLKSLGVAPQYWFATLRASGMLSPVEFDLTFTTIVLVDQQYLGKLRQQYQTQLRL